MKNDIWEDLTISKETIEFVEKVNKEHNKKRRIMILEKGKGKENKLKCWCKKCGSLLKSKREYIQQDDTCDKCYLNSQAKTSEWIGNNWLLLREDKSFSQKKWLPADEYSKEQSKGIVKKYIEALEDELDNIKSKSILILSKLI